MRARLCSFLFTFALLSNWLPVHSVQAASSLLDTGEFGYGAYLSINNPGFDQALKTALDLNLDWIGVEFSWAEMFPQQNSSPDWSNYTLLSRYANAYQIPVLVSITNPPTWAMTPKSPDSDLTLQLIQTLSTQFSGSLQAVELFPGANTWQGWGVQPNPKDYAKLFLDIHNHLEQDGSSVNLIAGGLKPCSSSIDGMNISDLEFLQGLYDADLAGIMPIISLQLSETTGDPLTAPSADQPYLLRRYELIRQVMLKNKHTEGMLWITQLTPPSGNISAEDQMYQSCQSQADWIIKSYTQIRSQLYISTAFLPALNPPSSSNFILSNGINYHPLLSTLSRITGASGSSSLDAFRHGKVKDESLSKRKTGA